MYAGDEDREGLWFFPEFVDVDEPLWAWADRLVQLEKQWKRLRRLLRQVRCLNPETGIENVLFSDFVDSENPRFPESPHSRQAFVVDMEFFEDGMRLNRCLCDGLAVLSPKSYLELLELQAADVVDESRCREFCEQARLARQKQSGLWEYMYLDALVEACSIVHKWDVELSKLVNGEHRGLWRAYASTFGAQEGGRKSAEVRARHARLTPSAAVAAFHALRDAGRPERSIAAIIAQRHEVSADYVRRVLKRAEVKPT